MEHKNILKQLREKSNMTQEEVAGELEVSTKTIQNWESEGEFRRTSDLHRLLDLYNTNEETRNFVVLSIYGKNDARKGSIEFNSKINNDNTLKKIIQVLSEEKDLKMYDYYPLDRIVSCLTVINNRLNSLKVSEEFLQNSSRTIWGEETALLIDKICSDYGIDAGAVHKYKISEMNFKSNSAFPVGDAEGCSIESEEFAKTLDYEEYRDALWKKIDFRPTSSSEEIDRGLQEIRKDIFELDFLRDKVLNAIMQIGFWSDDISCFGFVDVYAAEFWETISISRIALSFKKASTEERMRKYLEEGKHRYLSISRIPRKSKKCRMDIYCCAQYFDKNTVAKAASLLGNIACYGYSETDFVSMEEWCSICEKSEVLKSFIEKIEQPSFGRV